MLTETVSYPMAFIAGLVSFFTPCILPLIPAYFTFITGCSLKDLTTDCTSETRTRVFLSTLSYVMGFSFIFILMGASASYLGGLIYEYKDGIRIIGGIFIIILGIHLTGFVHIPGLDFDKHVRVEKKPLRYAGTFVIGMAFAAGWSPCIGPLLGSILIIAGSQESVWKGMALLSIYSAGLAIPFIVLSIFVNFLMTFIKKASRAMRYVNPMAGILLILVGISLVANKLTLFFG